MITSAGADDAALELLGRKLAHLVVRAAEFEGENGLQILTLEQHLVIPFEALGDTWC
jgi:hypothetical protein